MAQKKSQNALRELVIASGNVKPAAISSTYVGKSTNKQESMAAAIAARRASFASSKTPTISKQRGVLALHMIVVALVLLGAVGWGMNIYQLANSDFNTFTGILILRIAGIFVAPLGAILGFI